MGKMGFLRLRAWDTRREQKRSASGSASLMKSGGGEVGMILHGKLGLLLIFACAHIPSIKKFCYNVKGLKAPVRATCSAGERAAAKRFSSTGILPGDRNRTEIEFQQRY